MDKSGRPYISNGEVAFRTEHDSSRAYRHIIAEALVEPDLSDKELMEFYKCYDITEMPEKTKLFYIASEICESENHCRSEIEILLAMLKRGVSL